MKLAVSGKGGVGKTTVAAVLARLLAFEGQNVLAIDADPSPHLGAALGIPPERMPEPISRMEALIEERTQARKGSFGSFFKMNPKVEDLPDKLSVLKDGIRLLLLGTVDRAGGGCVCPQSVLMKALVTHLFLRKEETLIMDMEAGVEHLGRATATAVDMMLVVVEPGLRSIETAQQIHRLSLELGIREVAVVANKVRGGKDMEAITAGLEQELPLLAFLPYEPKVVDADLEGVPPYAVFDQIPRPFHDLLERIRELVPGR